MNAILRHRPYFVAGFCALALQIISYKLISVAGLGDALSVAISLTAFVSISGFGALAGDRLPDSAARILEMLLGLYAITVFGIVYSQDPGLYLSLIQGHGPALSLLSVLAVIAPMAFIAGALIPAYERRSNGAGQFLPVYIFFHVGGALSLSLLEIFAMPTMGWSWMGMAFGVVCVINAALQRRNLNQPEHGSGPKMATLTPELRRLALKLLGISVVTGMAGMASYKAIDYLVGPNIRNYAMMTAAIFLGLGVSGIVAQRVKMSVEAMVALTGVGVLSLLVISVWLPALVHLMLPLPVSSWVIYGTVITILGIGVYALMGLSIPVATQHGLSGGWALFVVSLGNALGYWLYIGVAPWNADAVILYMLGILLMIAAPNSKRTVGVLVLSGLYFAAPYTGSFMALHHQIYAHSTVTIMKADHEKARIFRDADYRVSFISQWNTWAWPVDVMSVEVKQDSLETKRKSLVINGFSSLNLTEDDMVVPSESAASLLPALFSKNYDRALVIGAGSGVSAGAVAPFFDETDLVDISPDAPSMIKEFGSLNNLGQANYKLINKDAMSHISGGKKYDYIFSTVTGAGYTFSSMLYTQEFFHMASDALTKGGVFSFWMDDRMSFSGASMVMKSVEDSFKYSDVMLVRPVNHTEQGKIPYIVVIASNSPLNSENNKTQEIAKVLRAHDNQILKYELENNYISPLKSREIELCFNQDVNASAMTHLGYAYEFSTELSDKQVSFKTDLFARPQKKELELTCSNKEKTPTSR